ncbi:MAG: GGDEF domain-containing protein [Acidobacteria bacterium]|nr:GGDEF domain-containing protein [Acidobacteriota bacterium]
MLLAGLALVVFVTLPQISGDAAFGILMMTSLAVFAIGRAGGLRTRPIEPLTGEEMLAISPDPAVGDRRPLDDDGDAATDVRSGPQQSADTAINDESFLSFMQELVASPEHDGLRATLQKHLPRMLGSRVVWITSYLENRRQVIVAPALNAAPGALLNADGQAWTTYALRIGPDVIGGIGVDSALELPPQVKRLMQLIAPIIAQAVNTAHMVETLKEASLVDLLTGAATRREGLSRFRAESKRAQRTGVSMAVLMLDLDRFKSINDRFGHGSGDAVLTAVGRTMLTTLRASDVRCRWGGEEFLIVLPDTDLNRAQVVAAGLLRNIAATVVPTPAGPVSSSASIGLTICRPGETDVDAIIRRADMALYRAKEAGRACVRVVLGDRDSSPVGVAGSPQAARTTSPVTLPFPDRRNPLSADRRGAPSPGRRRTDPAPGTTSVPESSSAAGERRAHPNRP